MLQLTLEKENLTGVDGLTLPVIDEDSNDDVGHVAYKKGVGREVTLFGRYKGMFQTQ